MLMSRHHHRAWPDHAFLIEFWTVVHYKEGEIVFKSKESHHGAVKVPEGALLCTLRQFPTDFNSIAHTVLITTRGDARLQFPLRDGL
jgi:hypothetical protein